MKPTEQQKQWLQDYLHQAMAYRETCEEVYDHILQALEHKPAQPFFEATVSTIIDEDFGGSDNMLMMEEDCKYNVGVEVKAQYWRNVLDWFKFPLIVGTSLFFLCLYYLSNHFIALLLVWVFVLLLPIIIFALRGFTSGYKSGDTKTSIRDGILRKIVYKAFVVYGGINVVSSLISTLIRFLVHYQAKVIHVSINARHPFLAVNVLVLTIHALSLFKLYRDEFKTGISPVIF